MPCDLPVGFSLLKSNPCKLLPQHDEALDFLRVLRELFRDLIHYLPFLQSKLCWHADPARLLVSQCGNASKVVKDFKKQKYGISCISLKSIFTCTYFNRIPCQRGCRWLRCFSPGLPAVSWVHPCHLEERRTASGSDQKEIGERLRCLLQEGPCVLQRQPKSLPHGMERSGRVCSRSVWSGWLVFASDFSPGTEE